MRLAGRHQNRPRPDSNHNAKLTDTDVELLLTLHGEGWRYLRLAAKLEGSKSLVRYIFKGRWRGQIATGSRWVRVKA